MVAIDSQIGGLDLETAVEIAIEVGAEDVIETTESDDTPVFQVFSSLFYKWWN